MFDNFIQRWLIEELYLTQFSNNTMMKIQLFAHQVKMVVIFDNILVVKSS